MATSPGKPSGALLGDEALSISQKLQLSLTASPNQGTLIGCITWIIRISKKTNDPKDLHSNSLASFYLFSPTEIPAASICFPRGTLNFQPVTQGECFLLKWVLTLASGPFFPSGKEGDSDVVWWRTKPLRFWLILVAGNQSCCIWSMGKSENCRSITPLLKKVLLKWNTVCSFTLGYP